MQPSDTDLQQLSDRLLELPFLAEFWDTKALHRADLVGIWRAVNILKRPEGADAMDVLRAARTLGLFLPRFPDRMALYRRFGLTIPMPFSPSASLLKYQLRTSAPWLQDAGTPPVKQLLGHISDMHLQAIRWVDAYEANNEDAVDTASMEVRIQEEQISQVLEHLDEREVLRFIGGIPL